MGSNNYFLTASGISKNKIYYLFYERKLYKIIYFSKQFYKLGVVDESVGGEKSIGLEGKQT